DAVAGDGPAVGDGSWVIGDGGPDAPSGSANTQHLSPNTFERLASLVDKSLLRQEQISGEPRLTMLETIREFLIDRLEASGEVDLIRRRHAVYVVALAETADRSLLGPQQVAWLNRLDREHDNIRAALTWCRPDDRSRPDCGRTELGARLVGALFW